VSIFDRMMLGLIARFIASKIVSGSDLDIMRQLAR
jgi:hypothetical protein